MSVENWARPETLVTYRITVSRDDHVVTVRGAAYFISHVAVSFRRIGSEWSKPHVRLVGSDRRGRRSDTVWNLKQLDAVPAWLESIIDRATPVDSC